MIDDSSFLRMIVERHADDGPRLAYADWLEEHGRCEESEFIRLATHLAAYDRLDPNGECMECARRERRPDRLLHDDDCPFIRRYRDSDREALLQAWLRYKQLHTFDVRRVALPDVWVKNAKLYGARQKVRRTSFPATTPFRVFELPFCRSIEFFFVAGFVGRVSLSWHRWLTAHEFLRSAFPIREVHLETSPRLMGMAFDARALGGVAEMVRIADTDIPAVRLERSISQIELLRRILYQEWPDIHFSIGPTIRSGQPIREERSAFGLLRNSRGLREIMMNWEGGEYLSFQAELLQNGFVLTRAMNGRTKPIVMFVTSSYPSPGAPEIPLAILYPGNTFMLPSFGIPVQDGAKLYFASIEDANLPPDVVAYFPSHYFISSREPSPTSFSFT